MTFEYAIAIGAYLLLMLAIGIYAYRTSTRDLSEYMLGGRRLHPAVGALSAGASDMSGWLLMGLPGAVFVSGVSAAWIAVGLSIGAYLNYRYLAPRLRVFTEMADDAITVPDYFENRFNDTSHVLRMFSALVIVVFFTLYTSAGLVAGGKLFETVLAMPGAWGLSAYTWGVIGTGLVVVAYTMVGGFMAVSLTDFVQGTIMFLALILVPIVTYLVLTGSDDWGSAVVAATPDAFNWWPESMTVIGLISLMAWGLGYFGQPHIIVRFMAIRSLEDMAVARYIGMGWMLMSIAGAVLTGLIGLAYATSTDLAVDDPETIFILLSQILFHPLIAGFLLAAILAAIMSTISSQLLVSSSSLTEDVYKTLFRRGASDAELVMTGRIAVAAVAFVAGGLALDPESNILSLVGNAWAGFGAAFGPVLLLSLYWRGLTRDGALAGMVAGAATVLVWLYAPVSFGGQTLSQLIYEIVPGFIASAAAAIAMSRLGRTVKPAVADQFDAMDARMGQTPQPVI